MFSKFSEDAQKVLMDAKREMQRLKHPYVGSEHMLLAILSHHEFSITKKLESYGIFYKKFRDELVSVVGLGKNANSWFLYTPLLKRVLESAMLDSKEEKMQEVSVEQLFLSLLEEGEGVAIRLLVGMNIDIDKLYNDFSTKIMYKKSSKKKLSIEEYAVDFNKRVQKGEIDPVIGREEEVARLIEILSRRVKNNPLLIGDAGVGKTAIVEELASRIENGEVPKSLQHKRILSVSMASLIAGTKYRGEFEERINKILTEVENNNEIILFIDEIHTLVGAGGAEGAIDASNILKPALARGKLKVIGATTTAEYKEFMERDKALDRRFQKLVVEEPEIDKVKDILQNLKPIYESFHGTVIPDDILDLIILLTNKYVYDRRQPDKAIDILDEVCAKASLSLGKNERRLQEINKKLKVVRNLKNQSIMNQNFEQASNYKKEEYDLEDQKNKLELQFMKVQKPKVITKDMVREVVYLKTKIPIYELGINLNKEMDKLSRDLKSKIMGQDDIVNQLVTFTQKYKSNYLPQRPYSFLFVGGTGLGKTCLIKEYAKTQVPKNSFIRIDMSEYKEEHSISKLIGSPPGYVGYNDQNAIFDKVREYPNSILLLDEIEKAHPAVLKLFLQILDEGSIKDNKGNEIVFKNTLIFMTSNLGSNQKTIGFSGSKKELRNVYLEEYLGVELVNRIDHIWYFHNMDGAIITTIIKSKLDAIKKARNSVKIKFSKELIDEIKSRCDYQKFGARRIDKIIEEEVDAIIIDHLVQGKSEVVIEKLGTS